MATLSIPNSFTAGTTILSASMNANFSAVSAWAAGNIQQDNFGTMSGVVTWSVSSNVLAQNISSSSTAGIITVVSTGVLAATKAALDVTSASAQTTGRALAYLAMSNASSTIPALLISHSGSGGSTGALEVTSTTKGSIPAPKMTTAQKNAISAPTEGLQAHDTDLKALAVYADGAWRTQVTTDQAQILTNKTVKNPTAASKTANYTATTADYFIPCNASGGAFTVTLPAAAGNSGLTYVIKKTDSSSTAVTIDGNGLETIDGAATTTLNTQNETLRIQCDGSNWLILDRVIPSVWTSFTPTGSFTNTTYTGLKRRQGDMLQLWIKMVLTGTPAGPAAMEIILPDSLSIDTAKYLIHTGSGMPDNRLNGWCAATDNSALLNAQGGIKHNSGDPTRVGFSQFQAATGPTRISAATSYSDSVPWTWAVDDQLVAYIEVPISGWKG